MKRHTRDELIELRKWLATRPDAWWGKGRPFSPQFGWVDIYEADNWHCVYCGRDLAESEEVLAGSTQEHLVPQSFFSGPGQSANVENNVVASCAACNGLKGAAMPEKGSAAWKSRKAFIERAREFIAKERAERAEQFRKHAFHARAKRVWNAKNVRHADYLRS